MATAAADVPVAPTSTSDTTTGTTDTSTVVLDTTTATSTVNTTTMDTATDTSLSMRLACVQKSWVQDFVAGDAVVAEEDEEELLIALPG